MSLSLNEDFFFFLFSSRFRQSPPCRTRLRRGCGTLAPTLRSPSVVRTIDGNEERVGVELVLGSELEVEVDVAALSWIIPTCENFVVGLGLSGLFLASIII